jgi:hypothetical protein
MNTTSPDPSVQRAELSVRERSALRALARVLIPPSAQYGIPGADDDTIFAAILAAAVAEGERVRDALVRLDDAAAGEYAQLDDVHRVSAAETFSRANPHAIALLFSVVARCYYRDDRVMCAIEMEPRAPFPRGFEVEASELALLDPVRARARMYRDAY